MTTYSPSYGAPVDPTNVVGRRIGAWVIDLIIYLILFWGIVVAVGGFETKSYEGFGSAIAAERFCDRWEASNDGTCIPSDDSAITFEGQPVAFGVWTAHLIAYGILSGVLGGSLGKLAVGLRVVTPDGRPAGIGKNLLRTVLWVGDAVTCGIPIVGGIMMVSTKGHRRLGDMAANTLVVDKSLVGQPLSVPGLSAPGATYGPGYTPSSYGAPAGWDVGPTGPQQTGWGTAPQTPSPGTWGSPAPGQPAAGQPGGFGPAPQTPQAPQTPAAAPGADSPTWDPARNAYIQYDRELGSWMQWDDATNAWKPISQ